MKTSSPSAADRHQHTCLAPLTPRAMTTVVLGSMPGAASLAANEYYAHPRNAFWDLAATVFDIPRELDYAGRCAALLQRNVGLWDTLASCQRPGSLDTAIVPASVRPNDLGSWFADHPVQVIGLNGALAARIFKRYCLPALHELISATNIKVVRLPSSSPANATWSYAAKLAVWRKLSC